MVLTGLFAVRYHSVIQQVPEELKVLFSRQTSGGVMCYGRQEDTKAFALDPARA